MSDIHYREGFYSAEVIGQRMTETRNGNPQFELSIQPVSRIEGHAEFPLDEIGPTRCLYMVITPKTGGWVLDGLRLIGFEGDSFSQLDNSLGGDNFHSFIGKTVRVLCRHETWEEVTREKWRISTYQFELAATAVSRQKIRELDALFGTQLNTPPPSGKSQSDDEIAVKYPVDDGNLPPSDEQVEDIPF